MDVQPPDLEQRWGKDSVQADAAGALLEGGAWRNTVSAAVALRDHNSLDALLVSMLDVYRADAVVNGCGPEQISRIDTCSVILLQPNARTQLAMELGGPEAAADFIATITRVAGMRLGARGDYTQRSLAAVAEALVIDTDELLSHVEYPGLLEDAIARLCNAVLTGSARITGRRIWAMRQHFSPSTLAPRAYRPSVPLDSALEAIRLPHSLWWQVEFTKNQDDAEAAELMHRLLGDGHGVPVSMRQVLASLNPEQAVLAQQALLTHIARFATYQEAQVATRHRRRSGVGRTAFGRNAASDKRATSEGGRETELWPLLGSEYGDFSYRQVVMGLIMVCGLGQQEGEAVARHLLHTAEASAQLDKGLRRLANVIALYRAENVSATQASHAEYRSAFALLDELLNADSAARVPYARLARRESAREPGRVQNDLSRFLVHVLQWRLKDRTETARRHILTVIKAVPPSSRP